MKRLRAARISSRPGTLPGKPLRIVLAALAAAVIPTGCVSSSTYNALQEEYAELGKKYQQQIVIIADQEERLQQLHRQNALIRGQPAGKK